MVDNTEVLSTNDEIDLSDDSAVEIITAQFVVESAEEKSSDTDNGSGHYEEITLTSEAFPYPITLRFFTQYTPAHPETVKKFAKDGVTPLWVSQQRGQLKNFAKAVLGTTVYSRTGIVGKAVTATTRETKDGQATLGRFKAID